MNCIEPNERTALAPASLRPARQGGQSTMDYLVACAVLAFVLFVPVAGDPASPGQSRTTVQIVLDGFQHAYDNFSHAISLPT